MKKLISILTTLTLTTTSFSSMIACSNKKAEENKNQKKDKNGNSIWTKIPGLKNKPITSGDIWNEIKLPDPEGWNGKTRMSMMLDIMKIFNVSVLSNADKIDNTKVEDSADWGDLKSLLTQSWKELTESVNDEIKRLKDRYKKDKQKKWESEWKEFIDKNYDGKKDNLFAEKLVKSSEKNATSVLTSLLLSNQRELEEFKDKEISSWIQSLIKANDKTKWKTEHPEQVKNIDISIKDDTKALKSVDDIINYLNNNTSITEFHQLPLNSDLKIKSIPILDSNGKPKFLSSSIDGLTSHFQTFIIQKWFKVKKPLAVSRINFAFKSDSDKLANGIKDTDFDELTKTKINKFLSTNTGKWEDLMQTYNGTYASDLVTLDNTSFTPIFKLVAYGLATNNITPTVAPSSNLDFTTLLSKIDRKKPSPLPAMKTTTPLYTKVTVNSINFAAFIDDSGLHFLKIEGAEFLKDTTTTPAPATADYKKDKQLETISKWNNDFTKKAMSEKAIEINNTKTSTEYNNWLGNDYLKWLQNQSYINANDENSKLKFKIEDAFKKFAELSTSTSTESNEWWFWTFDFFKEYINKVTGTADAPKWYEKYIKFSGNNNDGFESILSTLESSINTNSVNEFINSLNKENKKIKDYANGYPKFDLNEAYFEKVIDAITTNNFWETKKRN